MHYTTIDTPRGVKILEDIIDDSTSVLATVFTLSISVRVMVVYLADIPRCVACILFWVHLFETSDCVYFQRSCNVTDLERENLLQEQVAATLLDPHRDNMPDLLINPDQPDQGWALMRSMVIVVFDETKNSDASTDVNDSIEDVNDYLVTASAAATKNFLDLSSAEIADREIKTWKTRTVPLESSRRVALRCCASFPLVGCVGEACTCYSCNFNSSRALIFHGG